jgi:hypothetical protein
LMMHLSGKMVNPFWEMKNLRGFPSCYFLFDQFFGFCSGEMMMNPRGFFSL